MFLNLNCHKKQRVKALTKQDVHFLGCCQKLKLKKFEDDLRSGGLLQYSHPTFLKCPPSENPTPVHCTYNSSLLEWGHQVVTRPCLFCSNQRHVKMSEATRLYLNLAKLQIFKAPPKRKSNHCALHLELSLLEWGHQVVTRPCLFCRKFWYQSPLGSRCTFSSTHTHKLAFSYWANVAHCTTLIEIFSKFPMVRISLGNAFLKYALM